MAEIAAAAFKGRKTGAKKGAAKKSAETRDEPSPATENDAGVEEEAEVPFPDVQFAPLTLRRDD